ncbi:thiamine phosphate synthase [Persephonella sp.]
MELKDLSLYVITDERLINPNKLYDSIKLTILGGASVIQYRAKNKSSKEMYSEALIIKKVCSEFNIPFIVNDRVDIATAVDADGVHVGQDDLDVEVVRRIIGFKKILGLSTKNLEQVEKANKLPVDYIGFGSVFPTDTKKDAINVGLDDLREAVKISIQPVVAIGGIKADNLEKVLKTGCKNIAVVSEIFKDDLIFENTKNLRNIIDRHINKKD